MSKRLAVAVLVAALSVGCATTQSSNREVRIDASSPEAAEASYNAMMDQRSQQDQMKLALAVLTLNMDGVKSVYETLGNPKLENPSIIHIREKVAGMTAEQIIKRAAQNPSVRIEVQGQ